MQENLLLIGFMGAGKTTVGRLLAQRLQTDHFDLDQLLIDNIGMDIAAYFAAYGEAAFRQQESKNLMATTELSGVISTGGGIVLTKANRQFLKRQQKVIYLAADSAELIRRVRSDQSSIRPLAQEKSGAKLAQLYSARIPFYQECATITIETPHKTPDEIVTEIIKKMEVEDFL